MSDRPSTSQVIISMTENGEMFLDMSINDYSDQAIEDFANLISSIGTIQLQIEALEMAASGMLESIPEKVDDFLTQVTTITAKNMQNESSLFPEEGQEDEPCIKPSDLF